MFAALLALLPSIGAGAATTQGLAGTASAALLDPIEAALKTAGLITDCPECDGIKAECASSTEDGADECTDCG